LSAGARRGRDDGHVVLFPPRHRRFHRRERAASACANFNLSVLVTDEFMARRSRSLWDLTFSGTVSKTVRARAMGSHHARDLRCGRARCDLLDRVNALNTLAYCEPSTTNPCGEQPLPPYGACLPGLDQSRQLVAHPFTEEARLDEAELARLAGIAVRFLDNVIDVSRFPL